MIKNKLKGIMYAIAPLASASFFAARARTYSQRYLAGRGVHDLNRRLADRLGMSVLSGPFTGMTLTPDVLKENLGPFLLGTYEGAIQSWIERAIAAEPRTVVDVGSKFGYYAVGLARRLSGSRVVAFDTDPWARRATAEMARANGCRVEAFGYCNRAALERLAGPGTFVISDCEGYEDVLFDADSARALKGTTLLIETHEGIVPGVEGRIAAAFSATHAIEVVEDGDIDPAPPVDLSWLGADDAAKAIDEFRTRQRWMLLTS
jgi:hypothetical protein